MKKSIKPKDKFILDVTCGGKNMWFNKNHPNCLYIDNRTFSSKLYRRKGGNFSVKPDVVMDNRKLDFEDNSFKLIVFDPPYFTRKEGFNAKSDIVQTYGYLDPFNWQIDLKKSFDECWRVLEDYGILIFKWNTMQIKKKMVLEVLNKEPLFGHSTKNYTNTIWFCFMKIPNKRKDKEK